MALALLVGVLVYALLMRRMTGESVLAAVLTTIALGILLRGGMVLAFGTQTQYPLQQLGWINASFRSAHRRASRRQACFSSRHGVVYGGLFVFLRLSRWGIRMRAAGSNPLLAAQRGIRLHGVYALAWGLATFTGGIAGMFLACDAGIEATLVTIGLKAFPAALVGGLDSLFGALIGSLVIASAEVLLICYVIRC